MNTVTPLDKSRQCRLFITVTFTVAFFYKANNDKNACYKYVMH